jgi:GTP-binding protein
MYRPRIAIVGRPNVGKSSLFNRLARRRVSIVDDIPGVTRDRVDLVLEIDPPVESPRGTQPIEAVLIDTGGYGVYTAEGRRYNEVGEDLTRLTPDIENQIRAARQMAEVVIFMVDAQAGITALDETVSRMLREESIPGVVIPVASKVDSDAWVAHGLEAAGFGLGEPSLISSTSGRGVRELIDRLHGVLATVMADRAAMGEADAERKRPTPRPIVGEAVVDLKVAMVGRRNVGKSTLINALAGEPRMIVSEIAGTTRDAVDVRFERDGQAIVAIDTAGLRKKKSFAEDVEFYAYHRMLEAIGRCDVAVLLLDATREVSQVDKKLSQELQDRYTPTVIVVNKIDQLDKGKVSPEDYLEYLTEQLRGLDYAPIVFISAKEGDGLDEMLALCTTLHAQSGHREPTASLNKTIETILQNRGPSSRLGRQARLYYASQVGVHPPHIVLKVNRPELFEGNYERYLMNRIREELPFSEVPIRLEFAARGRKTLDEVKQEGRRRSRAEEAAAANAAELGVSTEAIETDVMHDDDEDVLPDRD